MTTGEPLPVTSTRSQARSIVIGILTLPLFGVGLLVLLAVYFSKTRSAPCPHCGKDVRLRENVLVTHEACGQQVERRGELVYARAA